MGVPLALRWSRPLLGGTTPRTIAICHGTAERYLVSTLVEEDVAPLPPGVVRGLDLGQHHAVVLDTGTMVGNLRFFLRGAHRLAKVQR